MFVWDQICGTSYCVLVTVLTICAEFGVYLSA